MPGITTRDEPDAITRKTPTEFDITPLSANLKIRLIHQEASIPSPLTPDFGDWQSTVNDLPNQELRSLLQEVVAQGATLWEEISDRADFHKPGQTSGFLCWWQYLATEPDGDTWSCDSGNSQRPVSRFTKDLNYGWAADRLQINLYVLSNRFID